LDVNEIADGFRNEMTCDIQKMVGTLTRCRNMIKEERKEEAEFCKRVDVIERDMCDRVEKLKHSIDEEKAKLLEELKTLKSDRIKQVSVVIEGIEQHISLVENLAQYTEQLRDKGAASDVAQQMSNLHSRAAELVTLEVLQKTVNDLGFMKMSFTATTWPSQSGGSKVVVGQLHRKIGTIRDIYIFNFIRH
jgi:hypothetical protein